MTDFYPSTEPEPPRRPRSYWSTTPPWYVAMVAGILGVMLVILLVLLFRGDGDTTTAGDTTSTETTAETTTTSEATTTESSITTTTESTTTTTESTTTSESSTATTTESTTTTTEATTTTLDPETYRTAVWPWFESTVRYTDPVEAAKGFAEDFVGYADPVLGPFMQGDSRSGEVEVWNGPGKSGPSTIVLVRQLGPDDTWWVLGSVARDIRIEQPDVLDVIASPLTVSGESVAFEAHVDVAFRVDGTVTPVETGFVMGGGTEMAPFSKEFTFTSPGDKGGALMLFTISAADGDIEEASVLRIFYAD